MLRTPQTTNFTDPRRSVYRPIRRARIEIRESWQCVSINYPLVKIIKGCSIIDFVRSIFDTAVLLVILFNIMELEYEDVMLVKPKSHEDDGLKNATTFPSISRREYERNYKHTKESLCIIVGIAAAIVLCELPLSIFLFKAVQNQERSQMAMWSQTSLVFIFFNIVAFTALIVYTSKAGLILDNAVWVTEDGANLCYLIYMNILRTAMFDLAKGAEVIFVNAFSREIAKRNKVMALGAEQRGL